MVSPGTSAPAPPLIHTDTVVIGAGQAGLAAAYYLQQRQVDFRVLDAAPMAGAAWATRYDSLRLFSPAGVSGLPGLPWPGPAAHYPSRDETTAYLRQYAAHFGFPLEPNRRVVRLAPGPDGYVVETAAGPTYAARRVIIATGPYTTPKVPAWAPQLPAGVWQLPSRDYQRPVQLPGTGPVAVVGSGNSALQIAADVAATGRPVYVAFDDKTPAMPNNRLMWTFLAITGLLGVSRHTMLGRKMYHSPEPVVSGDLAKLRRFANVRFIGRAEEALPSGAIRGRRATSEPLEAVVWATGYRPDYGWVELPILEDDGSPRHYRGITEVPGVAFLGLNWLDSRRSALLYGAGPDARRVVAELLRMP
ncbi:NAD(P)-binding domain-containing protein [Hymenobacter sp. BT683]|uniref:NAD(P)-binding domain-containing protein n=1 Tax=Hymenobacter jeongseonensis TaxID=2791027 RepID=A0ABS0IJS0_9BACT|nr:NAD(P)-binding domain-containing protein [Hymenobacter jeongseonensis]MBF9238615.1 NAD(P)-binding domain-containing protein [Hymenobacter jeongseonensis]